VRMSEDKVRTKDSCWSVGTIYDPSELLEVSTADPEIGRGVTIYLHEIGMGCPNSLGNFPLTSLDPRN
jgi:hypothetical protein